MARIINFTRMGQYGKTTGGSIDESKAVENAIGLPWSEGNNWQSVDVPDEWLPIIESLHNDLIKIDTSYRLLQVKEKFGGLRYYISGKPGTFDELQARIRAAENEVAQLEGA